MQLDLPRLDSLDEAGLAGVAIALGAKDVAGWSPEEGQLARTARRADRRLVAQLRSELLEGRDSLGEQFCLLRSPAERRSLGATYTPSPIVTAMISWAKQQPLPERVIDPGAGSGRYLVAAARAFRNARLVGVEIDPLAAMLSRANIAVVGAASRAEIHVADFRAWSVPRIAGRTSFIGNPPYVRHHVLGETWKAWLVAQAEQIGSRASQLAGLHVHFFLATLLNARPGDHGAYVTAAEWLDVNYGQLVRELLTGRLGGTGLHVIEPTAQPFADAATTAAITCFEVGSRPASMRVRRVATLDDLGSLEGGLAVPREDLENARRWSPLTRSARRTPDGFVELGEFCRVHRGAVTGANKVWIVEGETEIPQSLQFPTVTKARELFAAGSELCDAGGLRRVVDLPVDLEMLDDAERAGVDRFLRRAKRAGADSGYIARSRRAWWSVGLRDPAPILATYMARRPPAFVRNRADARHINIAHGLYPREPLPAHALDRLAEYLATRTSVEDGRTYAGGLTKFEPREMERLVVPGPELLMSSQPLP